MKKNSLKTLVLLFCISASTFLGNAQELKYKATFTLNFITNIGWTNEQRQGDFVIGVVGKEALSAELRNQSKGKKFGNQNIVIVDFSKSNKIVPCQVLFVGKDAMFDLLSDKIIHNGGDKGYLLITESPNSIDNGAIVNFYMDSDIIRFEFSEKNARDFELTYNSRLAQMASPLERKPKEM